MKQTTVERWYLTLVIIIFGGIVLHAPLSVGLGVLFPGYELLIKSWKEIVMLLTMPLAVVLVSRRRLWGELAQDWVVRLLGAYAALHLVMVALIYRGAAAAAAGLAIDLRYVLFFGLVYVLVKAQPAYRLRLLVTAAIGSMVVVGFGVMQLFLPADILKYIGYSTDTIAPYLTVDKNPDYIRINSTLRGPNPLGAYVVIVLAVMASLVTRVRQRIDKTRARQLAFAAMAAGSLVVLWVSYSRSAYIGVLVAVGLVVMATVGRRLSTRSWVIGCVVLCALGGGLLAARGTTFVSNTLLHENPAGGSAVSSNDGHLESLATGFDRLLRQPFGAGVGSTGSASLHTPSPIIIENQYLFVAHEIGWLGLGLFAALFGLLLTRLWQRRRDWLALAVFASGIGLAIIGLLLPVWADDTVAIIWWGLAAVAYASPVAVTATEKERHGPTTN